MVRAQSPFGRVGKRQGGRADRARDHAADWPRQSSPGPLHRVFATLARRQGGHIIQIG
jgi:hypothetical protein